MIEAVGLSASDLDALGSLEARLGEVMPRVAERFYSYLLGIPEMAAVFSRGGHDIRRLQRSLIEWGRGLGTLRLDAQYAEERSRLGRLHVHLGVELRHMLAAFAFLRAATRAELRASPGAPPSEAALVAFDRVLDLELCLWSDSYSYERQAVLAGQKDAERSALEARLSGLLAAGSVLVVALDADARITFFSPAVGALAPGAPGGHAPAPGSPLAQLLGLTDDESSDRAAALDAWLERVTRGVTTEASPPIALPTKTGDSRWIVWTPSPVRGPGGELLELILLGHDVTEERRVAEQMLLQEKMAALGLLASGVAHEIGNPLSSISSVTQTLQRKVTDPFVREKLELVRGHIDRITGIVRQLVDYARPTRFEWRSCHLNRLVASALELLEFDRRARGITVASELDPALPAVRGVEDQLTQVLFNLFVNALDAQAGLPQGGRLQVTTRRVNRGGRDLVEVEVGDAGPGVPRDLARRIFEPFFSTKATGHGTGLGLAVSARIAQEHGGGLVLANPGVPGARFVLHLPVLVASGETRPARARGYP